MDNQKDSYRGYLLTEVRQTSSHPNEARKEMKDYEGTATALHRENEEIALPSFKFEWNSHKVRDEYDAFRRAVDLMLDHEPPKITP